MNPEAGQSPPAAPVLLVGAGRMGCAMLAGWLAQGLGPVVVVDPAGPDPAGTGGAGTGGAGTGGQTPLARLAAANPGRLVLYRSAAALARTFSPGAMVLAVKPQVMEAALADCRHFARPHVLVLSVAAGKGIAWFRERLGHGCPLVRAMPNLPAAIGRGATVALMSAPATALVPDAGARALAQRLLGVCGTLDWLEDEALFDSVTAVSGSGPAYLFLLVETLARAGVEAGLPPDLAGRLARTTVTGAAALLDHSPETAAALREGVTSPGGTTRAALDVLMAAPAAGGGMAGLMSRAVAAAAARARALG